MNHRTMQEKVAERLEGAVGWERHPTQPFHFRHLAADVHVMVYATSLAVTFGPGAGQRYDKSVNASFVHFPSLALDSTIEVAQALVTARTTAARERELSEAWRQTLAIGGQAGG